MKANLRRENVLRKRRNQERGEAFVKDSDGYLCQRLFAPMEEILILFPSLIWRSFGGGWSLSASG